MNKFKVGDKVITKKNLIEYEKYGGLTFFSEMTLKRSRKIEICDESDKTYKIHNSPYWYSEEMLDFVK